eukprot:COSAG02_NODE_55474_length_290_cov_1.031414_1_plen_52_part_10
MGQAGTWKKLTGVGTVAQHTLAYTFTEDSLNGSASAVPSIGKGTIVQWAPIA